MNNFSFEGLMFSLSDSIKANSPVTFSTFPSLNLMVTPLAPTSKHLNFKQLTLFFYFKIFAKLIMSLGNFPNRSINSASKDSIYLVIKI